MESLPSERSDQPIDLVQQVLDEHAQRPSPEEIDSMTAECVRCYTSPDAPSWFTAEDIKRCRRLRATEVAQGLNHLTSSPMSPVVKFTGGKFAIRTKVQTETTPEDCYRKLSDERKALRRDSRLPEKLNDACTLTCISCIFSRLNGNTAVIKADNLATCVEFGRTKVQQALVRLATQPNAQVAPLDPENLDAGYKVLNPKTLPNVIKPLWCHEIAPRRQGKKVKLKKAAASPVQKSTPTPVTPPKALPEPTIPPSPPKHVPVIAETSVAPPAVAQKQPGSLDLLVRQCLNCHAQQHPPTKPERFTTTRVAKCIGTNRNDIGKVIQLLVNQEDPLLAKETPSSSARLTPRAYQIASEQPVECLQEEEHRRIALDGIIGCIRCFIESPETAETINAQGIADCRGIPVSGVNQALAREDIPLATTKFSGLYRPTPEAFTMAQNTAWPPQESAMTCNEQFITWASEVPKATPHNIKRNLIQALHDGLVAFEYDGPVYRKNKPPEPPIHYSTGKYLVVGPALSTLQEPARQAVLHVLGLDELVYGQRLDRRTLEESLGLQQKNGLSAYVQFSLHRLAAQKPTES